MSQWENAAERLIFRRNARDVTPGRIEERRGDRIVAKRARLRAGFPWDAGTGISRDFGDWRAG
jgi:hypothetical protein